MSFLTNFAKIQQIRRAIPPLSLRGIIRFININYTTERIIIFVHRSLHADSRDYLRYIFWSYTNSEIDTPFDIQIENINFPCLHPRFGRNRYLFAQLGNPRAPLSRPVRRIKRLSSWERELAAQLVPDLVLFANLIAHMINTGPPPMRL